MLDDSHPLTLELDSLRSAVARFQDEAHNASVKLQRFSFDTSNSQDRIAHLERENEVLRNELSTLRANPHPDTLPESHPAVQQSQELTLALRKLSDKLSLTEETLQTRTVEISNASSEVARCRTATEAAYALAAQIRGREEEGKVRERDLERKVMEAKEEARMSDLVVKEYADLVRSLEGRGSVSSNSTGSLVNNLSEGKLGLQKLFNDFSSETEKLQAEVARLQGALAESQSRFEAERKGAEADRVLLAQIQHQLEKLRLDDRTAAKMVSRYMKFSQTSTDTLQVSLNTLKTRHSATIDTLMCQITELSRQLRDSEATSDKLRTTLDELGKDIMRESFGRRREIALRLRLLTREQVFNDGLEKLVRRTSEASERHQLEDLTKILDASKTLLASLNGSEEVTSEMSSLARLVAAESTVRGLVEELRTEKEKRLYLETGRNDLIQTNGFANGDPQHVAVREKTLPSPPHMSRPHTHTSSANSPVSPPVILPSVEEAPSSSPPESLPDVSTSSGRPLPSFTREADAVVPSSLPSPQDVEAVLASITSPTDNITNRDSASASSPSIVIGSVLFEETLSDQLETPDLPVVAFPSATRSPSPISPTPQAVNDDVPSAAAVDTNPESESVPHPLLAELALVGKRYDDLSRAFRDCHLALQELKKQKSSSSLFHTAVDRLDDYTEDARVELEIRTADEALMAHGYETMLLVPGATLSPSPSHTRGLSHESVVATPTLGDLESRMRAFASGSDPAVQKARLNLEQKLADVQHDIAKLKLAIYEQQQQQQPAEDATEIEPSPASATPSSSSGWASWLSSPNSRPSSPSPAPTFGNVMTTPRLRHASSITRLKQQQQQHNLSPSPREDDTFANLGLKIAMPSINISNSYRSASFSHSNSASPIQRSRTVSMLGLGGAPGRGSGSSPRLLSAGGPASPARVPSSISRSPSSSLVVENGAEEEEEIE
ncbi:hypothetical protein PM082_006115 [Marasmius tenuissimus]|nr:hypothetical protein PM082_006115 [Marasmius tenuissimus]